MPSFVVRRCYSKLPDRLGVSPSAEHDIVFVFREFVLYALLGSKSHNSMVLT